MKKLSVLLSNGLLLFRGLGFYIPPGCDSGFIPDVAPSWNDKVRVVQHWYAVALSEEQSEKPSIPNCASYKIADDSTIASC